MPTYQYKCSNTKCDIHNIILEVKQKMTDKPLQACPDCSEPTLSKVITSSGGFRIGGLGVNKPTAHWGDLS